MSVSKQSVRFEMIFKCKIYIKFVFFVGAKSSKLKIHHPLLKFISSEPLEFDPQIQIQILQKQLINNSSGEFIILFIKSKV